MFFAKFPSKSLAKQFLSVLEKCQKQVFHVFQCAETRRKPRDLTCSSWNTCPCRYVFHVFQGDVFWPLFRSTASAQDLIAW